MEFEVIIGIEVHVELKTKTKMFSSAPIQIDADSNTCTNEIDLGHPGVLPSLNKKAVELAIKACQGFNCEIDSLLRFDRKNYYYSDLAKGFQITQQFYPIGKNGYLEVLGKKVRINRIHLEEDTAKQYHEGNYTKIDYNRASTPLIEIVSEPDIRSAEQASKYVENLRNILVYLNVSDGKMEEGSLRCDINISLRPLGYHGYGNKVEIKNLNSISNVQKAIAYEIKRQRELYLSNQLVVQETRRYDEEKKATISMRVKEGSVDYKYFCEPNLIPIQLDEKWIAHIIDTMEELPEQKYNRYLEEYGLSEYDSKTLIASKEVADFFEACVQHTNQYKMAANWTLGEVSAFVNKEKIAFNELLLDPKQLAILIDCIESKEISSKQAKTVFEEIVKGKNTNDVIQAKNLRQISDVATLEAIVKKVLSNNEQSVSDYHGGKDRAFGFLVGQIMKESKGQANPKLVSEILKKQLANAGSVNDVPQFKNPEEIEETKAIMPVVKEEAAIDTNQTMVMDKGSFKQEEQGEDQVGAKTKKKRKFNWYFWIIFVILLIPFLIVGFELLLTKDNAREPVVGNRFENELENKIEKESLVNLAEQLKGENIESVNINFKSATLRILVDVKDDLNQESVQQIADQIYNKVTEIYPVETYFTNHGGVKMYDLAINVYTIRKPQDQANYIFIAKVKNAAGTLTNDVLSSPRNQDVVNKVKDITENGE